MKLGNITQIILYVADMEKQVKFYRDVLGLKIAFPQKTTYDDENWVSFNTGPCTLALHAGGQGRIGEDAPRFTFEVDDVKTTRNELIEKGVEMSEIVEAYPGSYVSGGFDPEKFGFYIQSHPDE